VAATAVAALVGAAVCLAATPYLARVAGTAHDLSDAGWWRPAGSPNRVVLASVAAVGVLLGALAGAGAGWSVVLPALVLLALVATPLVVIDLDLHRLPNRLVLAAAIGGAVLLTGAAAEHGQWSSLLRVAEGGAAAFAVLMVLNLVAPRSFGFGDVKLGGVLGGYLGWFGWSEVYYGLFAGFVLGAAVSVALLVSRRATMKSAIPFGPVLILGALVVLAFDLAP
jgi:leader peptidase (prepilin peptidase) / N-methyltransferase